jgi:AcrR family transcriptional regulator
MATKKAAVEKAAEPTKRAPGRPRSEQARRAILGTTLKFLETEGNGFTGLTIEQVAADAGVGKATVYRWWPNKAALVADAFANSVTQKLHFPDTGSVTRDIKLQMQQLIRILRSRRGRIMAHIVGAGQSDPTLIRAFRERFMMPRRAEAYGALERGIERGELPRGLDMDLTLDALYGAVYIRFLVRHDSLSPEFIDGLVPMVLNGAAQKPSAKKSRKPLRRVAG